MDGQRKAGNELLAISHNANLSDGLMFPLDVDSKGRPIDAAWAADRLNNEPLTEIKQVKGTSETTPELSPNDEFASFEIMNYLIGLDNSTPTAWQLRSRGLQKRPGHAGHAWLQPLQDRSRRRGRFAQHGFGLHPVELLRRSRMIDPTPEIRLAGKVESGMDDPADRNLRTRWRVG